MYYPYDSNQLNQPAYPPPPGAVLPAGQTVDVIYAQSYANLHNQSATPQNRYDPVGVDYYNQPHDPYTRPPPQPTQDYSYSQPTTYETESSQRFKINPSYADTVHVDSYGSTQYGSSSQYPEYSSTQSQYPPPPSEDAYSTTQYNEYNVSQQYQSHYNGSQSSFSGPSYSPTLSHSGGQPVPSQDQWQSQSTQWQPTQLPPAPPQDQWQSQTTQWQPQPTQQSSSSHLYPSLQSDPSVSNLQYPPSPSYQPSASPYQPDSSQYQSSTSLPYQSSSTTSSYQPSTTTNLPSQAPSIASQYQPNTAPSPLPTSQGKPVSPQLKPISAPTTQVSGKQSPTPHAQSALQQQVLAEERQKMEKEREELKKQQEVMRQKQDELRKQEEAMKALHAQEAEKLRTEIEREREEVAKMKAELAKQNDEQKQQQVQKDKVIEIQKGEMKRQMEELMRERELVKKHEEEMRNAMLQEQRLVLQQLKQQQAEVAQQQQAILDKAREAELQRQREHQAKLEAQRKQEEELQKSRLALEQQQQAIQRQMEEAKEAARKLEETQRIAAEQQQKVAAQQKQTEEQRRLAEEKRKQAEEKFQQALMQQKQQQEAFAQQQEELKKRQEQLAAEQERVRNQNRESESKIEAEKKLVSDKLQEQQRLLQQQQEEIKRQQELVTLQQKELLIKQKEQKEQAEKEQRANTIKDMLAPMRHTAGSWQPSKPPPTAGKLKQPPLKPLPSQPPQTAQPVVPARPQAPGPVQPQAATPQPSPRVDSRTKINLNLDQVVDGYLLRDVVRAQRYARRWLMRRHFVKLVQQYHTSDDKTAEKLRHRNKSLREIYTSELSYVANLQLLSNFYLVPMQVESMVLKSFTDKDSNIIFSSVNTLLDVSKNLVAELEARLDKWPSVQLFGDIFVRLAPVMKLYAEYINNFDAASQRLKSLLATPEGYQFFEKCKTKSRSQLDINSLLIMPVQRVPRYELLLKELIKFTEESHVDYQNLNQALKAIQQVNMYINQKKKDVDSRQKLTAIQNTVKGSPNLMLAHRYYVHEGPLQVSSTDKHKTGNFYFFLFNDMLMATRKSGGLFHRHEYEYVFSIDLNEAVVKSVADNLMFRIMTGGLEDINVAIYTFLCQNNAEKDIWMKHFVGITEDTTNSKRLLVKEASVGNFH